MTRLGIQPQLIFKLFTRGNTSVYIGRNTSIPRSPRPTDRTRFFPSGYIYPGFVPQSSQHPPQIQTIRPLWLSCTATLLVPLSADAQGPSVVTCFAGMTRVYSPLVKTTRDTDYLSGRNDRSQSRHACPHWSHWAKLHLANHQVMLQWTASRLRKSQSIPISQLQISRSISVQQRTKG